MCHKSKHFIYTFKKHVSPNYEYDRGDNSFSIYCRRTISSKYAPENKKKRDLYQWNSNNQVKSIGLLAMLGSSGSVIENDNLRQILGIKQRLHRVTNAKP